MAVPLRTIIRHPGEMVELNNAMTRVVSVPESFLKKLPDEYHYRYDFAGEVKFFFTCGKDARSFRKAVL